MKFIKNLFKTKSNKISNEDVLFLNSIIDSISSKTDLEKCATQLSTYIKKNPDNAFLHQLIATAYFKNGKNESADLHLDKTITLGIKDGGYCLLIKAYNNMFDGYCSYDALDSLRILLNQSNKIENLDVEIKHGIYKKINGFGFQSHYIDMRSSETKAEILYLLATTSYDFNEKQEALGYLEDALKLCPEDPEYNRKYVEFQKEIGLKV